MIFKRLCQLVAAVAIAGALIVGCGEIATAAESENNEITFINATHVNMRERPSLSANVITQGNYGDQVYPLSAGFENATWTHAINSAGQICYIYSKYLSYGVPAEKKVEAPKEKQSVSLYMGIPAQLVTSLGFHKVTAYCSCEYCCGKGGGHVTAAGTVPTPGRTIGCNWLPLGTHVIIEGHEYIVEDRGASWVKGFDVFWGDDHQAALHSGLGRKIEVFKVEA